MGRWLYAQGRYICQFSRKKFQGDFWEKFAIFHRSELYKNGNFTNFFQNFHRKSGMRNAYDLEVTLGVILNSAFIQNCRLDWQEGLTFKCEKIGGLYCWRNLVSVCIYFFVKKKWSGFQRSVHAQQQIMIWRGDYVTFNVTSFVSKIRPFWQTSSRPQKNP